MGCARQQVAVSHLRCLGMGLSLMPSPSGLGYRLPRLRRWVRDRGVFEEGGVRKLSSFAMISALRSSTFLRWAALRLRMISLMFSGIAEFPSDSMTWNMESMRCEGRVPSAAHAIVDREGGASPSPTGWVRYFRGRVRGGRREEMSGRTASRIGTVAETKPGATCCATTRAGEDVGRCGGLRWRRSRN
jgi:hypothetical protein